MSAAGEEVGTNGELETDPRTFRGGNKSICVLEEKKNEKPSNSEDEWQVLRHHRVLERKRKKTGSEWQNETLGDRLQGGDV